MIEAYKKFFKNYVNFNGRSTRSDYWYVILINAIIGFVLGFIGGLIPDLEGVTSVISTIYSIAVFIPGIAIAVRRLHDINKSGWFYLLSFIPLVGTIILIVFYCMASIDSNNKYGSRV